MSKDPYKKAIDLIHELGHIADQCDQEDRNYIYRGALQLLLQYASVGTGNDFREVFSRAINNLLLFETGFDGEYLPFSLEEKLDHLIKHNKKMAIVRKHAQPNMTFQEFMKSGIMEKANE